MSKEEWSDFACQPFPRSCLVGFPSSLSEHIQVYCGVPAAHCRPLATPFFPLKMPKPIVLHLGAAVKYSKDFYDKEFAPKYHVVRNEDLDRESFKAALQSKKYLYATNCEGPKSSPGADTATSPPYSARTSKPAARWASGTTS